MTPNETPEPGHLPAHVEPSPGGPPPGGLLHLIMQHRFLVVSLVVVLFLGSLFAWEARRGGSTPAKSAEPAVVMAPHGGPAPAAPKELEVKPLLPVLPKGAHEAGLPVAPLPQLTHEPAPAAPKASAEPRPAGFPGRGDAAPGTGQGRGLHPGLDQDHG